MAALLVLCCLLALSLAPAVAAQRTVAAGGSIAEAIAAAAPGDVVAVERGTYPVHLVIDKPLTLRGIGRPTLTAGNQGDVIRIKAADVTIEGFIVRDSGADLTAQNAGIYIEPGADRVRIVGNDLVYNLFGLWIEKVQGAEVHDNRISGKRDLASAQRGNGIQLYNSGNARVTRNEISFARDGIYVDVSHHAVFRGNRMHHLRYGTHYMNSNDNLWEDNEVWRNRGGLALMEVKRQVIRNNRAWDNSDFGIMLRTIQDSTVEGNVVAGNSRGFFVYDAEYNTLRGNLVTGNRVGAHVWAGTINNTVDGNDFIENREQIRYVAARDVEWGGAAGNYWSNYRGWDADGDGRGDVGYAANDIVDRLVWRYPMLKLLLASPAVQSLRLVAQQFPLLRATSIVEAHPRMRPQHPAWRDWIEQRRD